MKGLTLPVYAIEFYPPLEGFDGSFNTFRLGRTWAKRLKVGDRVLLVDKKNALAFGSAEVVGLHEGTLEEMANIHGYRNHTQLGKCKRDGAEGVVKVLLKFFGPHIAKPTKTTVVIDLERLG